MVWRRDLEAADAHGKMLLRRKSMASGNAAESGMFRGQDVFMNVVDLSPRQTCIWSRRLPGNRKDFGMAFVALLPPGRRQAGYHSGILRSKAEHNANADFFRIPHFFAGHSSTGCFPILNKSPTGRLAELHGGSSRHNCCRADLG